MANVRETHDEVEMDANIAPPTLEKAKAKAKNASNKSAKRAATLVDDNEVPTTSRKPVNHNAKTRQVSQHSISDSEQEGAAQIVLTDSDSDDDEFLGFMPIQRKRARVEPAKEKPSSAAQAPAPAPPNPQVPLFPWPMGAPQAMAGQMAGHFHPMMMYPNYWPFMQPPMQNNDDDDEDVAVVSSEEEEDSSDTNDVTLEEHIKEADIVENVGPPVGKAVAKYVSKIWNKPMRENIKEVYDKYKRPENVACLQKVELDEELLDALPGMLKARKQDFALKALNNAFVHAAIVCCDTLELAMSADKDIDIRQKVVNSTVNVLKVLSYGAQSTTSLRKEQLKPVLHPLLKDKACAKKDSFKEVNNSHFLFGGEMPAQMKKGQS